MTEAELTEVLHDCPILYHMAEEASWPSIRAHGLLSTSALLDWFKVDGTRRERIESQRRPESVSIGETRYGQVVIRDNIPMDDPGLSRCLTGGLKPVDWYRILNQRVFFWLTKDRLFRLLAAKAYVSRAHDVLELDTASLVRAYRSSISLSPMNSGCTKPVPHARGKDTFLSIADYPYATWRKKRRRGERVVELAVAHGVPDIERFVIRVVRMRGEAELAQLYRRP